VSSRAERRVVLRDGLVIEDVLVAEPVDADEVAR
jgi:hypothetical protein